MEKKVRHFMSYILSLCMIFTFVIGNVTVFAADSITVHYRSSWGATNIYYWNTSPEIETVTWPGVAMTSEGEEWYTYTLPVAETQLIFCDETGSAKTGDLEQVSGEWWYENDTWYDYNPEAPTDAVIKVYFKSTGEVPYVYYWNAEPSLESVSWPGVAMEAEGEDWYSYTFNARKINLIFSNQGSNQTADLVATEGNWKYEDGSWTIETEPSPSPSTSTSPSTSPSPSVSPSTSPSTSPTVTPSPVDGIKVHYYSTAPATIYYWKTSPELEAVSWPGVEMTDEGNNWYGYELNAEASNLIFSQSGSNQTSDLSRTSGEWWYTNNKWYTVEPTPTIVPTPSEPVYVSPSPVSFDYDHDFREETIYFVMTSRFYDGDSSNNVHCWDDEQAGNPDSDPAWRGDFKGLIEKLDYIKALGFTAIWITPVVENASGYDYHGYHAINHSKVDSRYESEDATYQDLINACHEKGLKIIQDVVFNHTGNFGEENLYPLFKKEGDLSSADCLVNISDGKLPEDYDELTPAEQYQARLSALKTDEEDTNQIYHHEQSLSWEGYTVQTGQIAGDCVDLNTENLNVSNYLVDCYGKYLDMGVDAFRVDTVKHISRLTFNNNIVPQLFERAKAAGNNDFYMFGEVCSRYRQVWNSNNPNVSAPFYTWKDSQTYNWGNMAERLMSTESFWSDNADPSSQPTSNNYLLNGNEYHEPDWSQRSGLDVIDFPMHWNFGNASDAFSVAVSGDQYYNDATFNVTYVDSHDYAPDNAPENERFAGSQDTWAENLDLMFTFRGIPTIYYGSEIEFMKGAPIDVGPNAPLSTTGRAYFGDYIEGDVDVADFGEYTSATGSMASTLEYPLAQHIRRLNNIRRAVPALQKGQYSTADISGNMAFKRAYKDDHTDSFALVTISSGATFNNIPNGTYVEVMTGDKVTVTNGSLQTPSLSKANMRVYVLDTTSNTVKTQIGESGTYLN